MSDNQELETMRAERDALKRELNAMSVECRQLKKTLNAVLPTDGEGEFNLSKEEVLASIGKEKPLREFIEELAAA